MTANQIRFQEHKETQRHNLATERETGRHNVADETETRRSHVANEGIAQFNAFESQRHNLEVESINRFQASENARHNRAAEFIQTETLDETGRHNRVGETQTAFKNRGELLVNTKNAETAATQAETAQFKAKAEAAEKVAGIVLDLRGANQEDWHLRNETVDTASRLFFGNKGIVGAVGGFVGDIAKAIGFVG